MNNCILNNHFASFTAIFFLIQIQFDFSISTNNIIMSEPDTQRQKDQRKGTLNHQARQEKLKQIEALYRSQIKDIYNESKSKIQKVQINKKNQNQTKFPSNSKPIITGQSQIEKSINNTKSVSTINMGSSINSSKCIEEGERVRASMMLKGESTRTIQSLRRQNQTKQLKIRQLSHKCESLIDKLRQHIDSKEFQTQMESLRQYSSGKMERLQSLFKIKNEQIFFKTKLQIISLLQDFGVPKQDLGQGSQVNSESALFAFMTRKLKGQLKNFRNRQQESSFELQKDKILTQKQEERIHYLMETNQLLRLSQSKLKAKVQDLKAQLNQFLDKYKARQQQGEERESQIFRLRKQLEQANSSYSKLSNQMKAVNSERADERRVWEGKQKEMKMLLNNYFVQKKKIEGQLQEKEGHLQEIVIKLKFLEQQNERLSRQLVRWKERYDWQEKEKESKLKEAQQQKSNLLNQFEQYKVQHNQGIILGHRAQIDEAFRKLQEYQRAYQSVLQELDQQRRLLERAEEQSQQKYQKMEKQWLQRVKRLQKVKEEQMLELTTESEMRVIELQQEFQKKEGLLQEEMQARMKSLLAEKDKKTTQQLIDLENQNDQLRREIENLHKILDVKESLINVINSKKGTYD